MKEEITEQQKFWDWVREDIKVGPGHDIDRLWSESIAMSDGDMAEAKRLYLKLSQEDRKRKTRIGWKVVGLTFITWLLLSGLAGAIVYLMKKTVPGYSIFDAASVVWSWASLLMGMRMVYRVPKKYLELLWGGIFFVICLVPMYGVIAGVGYFLRCNWVVEKKNWK